MTRRGPTRAMMVGVLLPAALAVAAIGGGALGARAFGADAADTGSRSIHAFGAEPAAGEIGRAHV